jgi:hypothetical protein
MAIAFYIRMWICVLQMLSNHQLHHLVCWIVLCGSAIIKVAHENDNATWHPRFSKQQFFIWLNKNHWLDPWKQGNKSNHPINATLWLDGQTHVKWHVEESTKQS